MKEKWVRLLIFVVLVAIFISGGFGISKYIAYRQNLDLVKKTSGGSKEWNGRIGYYAGTDQSYMISVPEEWEYTEATESSEFDHRAIFKPSRQNGPIGTGFELAVTVISNPKKNQELSSQNDYNNWLAMRETDKIGTIEKVAKVDVRGVPGVIISERGYEEEGRKLWTLLGWLRVENKNYYVTLIGENDYGEKELNAFKQIFGSMAVRMTQATPTPVKKK